MKIQCEACKTKDLLIKDICEQWNEDCEESCDSYAHSENCKATDIGNAKKALKEENIKLRNTIKAYQILTQGYSEMIAAYRFGTNLKESTINKIDKAKDLLFEWQTPSVLREPK